MESIVVSSGIGMFRANAAGLAMKSTYYISPEDFFKMVDSTDRTPTLHIIEKDGTRTPIEPKRKIATAVPSNVKISSERSNSRRYISPEDFFRMVDSKDSMQIPASASKKEEQEPGKLILLPKTIPATQKLSVPREQALTKKDSRISELYDIKREGKIITIKKKETKKEQIDKKKIAKKIERSTKKQIRAEEKRLKKEEKKAERKARKLEKYRTIGRDKRYTEPKKRSLLGRIRLQQKLAKDYYFELEEDYEEGYITKKDVEASKNAKKRRDRKLYKEVQAYEDAMDDVTVRKGWAAFKLGLATTALAGTIALSAAAYHQVKQTFESFTPANQVVSVYEMDQTERSVVDLKMNELRNSIIEGDGYHFDNLSEDQFADGYYRIMNYEGKLFENVFKNAVLGDRDQTLLDSIVAKSFGESYATFTDAEKRDYKQLAFELLPYSLPDLFGDGVSFLRNPIVMDELSARDNANMRGYKITLRVNSDEKETVRNLGNIIHILNEMQESDYREFGSMEHGQQAFFDDILKEVIGEGYEGLKKEQIRDYKQIIYEWLPSIGKQYIKDPIVLERQAAEKTNDMEIGG